MPIWSSATCRCARHRRLRHTILCVLFLRRLRSRSRACGRKYFGETPPVIRGLARQQTGVRRWGLHGTGRTRACTAGGPGSHPGHHRGIRGSPPGASQGEQVDVRGRAVRMWPVREVAAGPWREDSDVGSVKRRFRFSAGAVSKLAALAVRRLPAAFCVVLPAVTAAAGAVVRTATRSAAQAVPPQTTAPQALAAPQPAPRPARGADHV